MSRRRRHRIAGLVVVALAAACSRHVPGGDAASAVGCRGVLVAGDEDDALVAWADVDGVVEPDWFVAPVTADRRQTVARTGYASGADQGKVLVFDPGGRRALDWRLPQLSPFARSGREAGRSRALDPAADGRERNLTVAGGGQVVPFRDRSGRRMLAVGGTCRWAPSPLVVLTFGDDGRATEHRVFWNHGSIRRVLVSGDRVFALGVNNDLDRSRLRTDLGERYASVLWVLDVGGDAHAQDAAGRSPRGEIGAEHPGGGYAWYVRLPVVQAVGREWGRAPVVEGATVRFADGDGREVAFDADAGRLTVRDGAGRPVEPDVLPAPQYVWRGP